ncbi:hypothetical protein BKA65DRAFT_500701 [Rhexocercosporidium sp. MPI-PUGE-AT-0058]|nr:hypothetical protein BKA65DRAFT_500701 [Rhexocercosporidium sp. MPI-PUGE-AT-0058]
MTVFSEENCEATRTRLEEGRAEYKLRALANIRILFIVKFGPRFPNTPTLPWSGPGELLEEFTLFTELLLELRDLIWSYAASEARMIEFVTKEKSTIDGELETFRGENIERHRAMGALPPGMESKKTNDGQARSRSKTSRPSFGDNTVAANSGEDTMTDSRSHDNIREHMRTYAFPLLSEYLFQKSQQIDSSKEKFMVPSATTGKAAITTESKDRETLHGANFLSANTPLPRYDALFHSKSFIELANALDTPLPEPTVSLNLPATLQVKRESRAMGLNYFKLSPYKERDGNPVYINYSVDEFRLRSCRALEVLCGINSFTERVRKSYPKLCAVKDENRSDAESILCFLSFRRFDYTPHPDVSKLITRFRNLKLVSIEKLVQRHTPQVHALPRVSAGSRMVQYLEGLWKKDDEQRGIGCKPNKIPVCKYPVAAQAHSVLLPGTIANRRTR